MELGTCLFSLIFLSLLVCLVLFRFYADADLTLLYYHSLDRPRDFDNKVIWITGASSGIGENLAYTLVKLGAKLALSGVNVERLTAVGERCKEISNCAAKDILLVPFQINNFEVHDECVNKVLDHFGQIDILVNNAGISQRAEFADVDIAIDQQLFSVNVFGTINLTRKVLKHFLQRNKGVPFSCPYTASKHALHGYFESLRSEMVEENINVTLVCPGPVFSGLTERCLTGKVGEKFDHEQKPTDKRMTTERCSDLIATAIYYKLDESWIAFQPILFTYYMVQYIPTIFRTQLPLPHPIKSENEAQDFRNKVVWITGASSGIGEHLAYRLVKSGAKLALSGVNVERLKAVGERCKKISKYAAAADTLLVPFEINNFEAHDECVKQVLDHFGRIDILVNNAGIGHLEKFSDMDKAVDHQVFSVNVFGTVNLTRKVLKHFLERKKGHIVVTSSSSGKLGTPYTSAYTGTKYALHGYFECLRSEMVGKNIDITLVCPGPVVSRMTSSSPNGKVDENNDRKQQPTFMKMSTERCCDLMATAISYKLEECWISLQPFLLAFYVAQYFPSKFRTWAIMHIIKRYFKRTGKRLASKDGADSH
ncbi:unnamed protein product [Larinioides sclopetarius]|uniref:Dehydrogenase/reductase SDR family member 7 n=1 Tax=Larinioides sclopetarius TaxID=280406 RepID=A0AAV2BF78_9ARAC